MTRLTNIAALAALLLISGGMGHANSYRKSDLIDCLEMADQVVIGRLSDDFAKPELNVTEVLKGPPATVIRGIFNHIEGPQVELDVLFMKAGTANPSFMPLHYLARGFGTWQLVHMLKDPAPALAADSAVGPVGTARMLGYLFDEKRKLQQVGTLSRDGAVDYLRGLLRTAESPVVLAGLGALSRMRETTAVPEALALLEARPPEVVVAALGYLGASRDPRAVAPVRAILRESQHGPHASEKLSRAACKALVGHDDPAVIPELAMALQAGIEEANRILLRMDVPEAIGWILDQDGELLSSTAVESLYWLVRRSNQPPESWMKWNGWPCSEPGETARWRDWWQAHRADFKLIRSLAEAAKDHEREHPARIADPPRQKAPHRFGWTLAAIVGAGAVLWGLRRGWRAFKKSQAAGPEPSRPTR
jgi:hypothetical protein